MKNKIISFALVIAPYFCLSNDYFVGGGISVVNYDKKIILDNVYTEKNEDAMMYNFKLGVKLDNIHRVSLNNNFFDDNEDKLSFYTLNYDYISPVNKSVDFFVGVNLGVANYSNLSIDGTGLTYGFQGGLLFDITKNIEIETSVSYSQFDISEDYQKSFVTYNNELKNLTNINLGINFKF